MIFRFVLGASAAIAALAALVLALSAFLAADAVVQSGEIRIVLKYEMSLDDKSWVEKILGGSVPPEAPKK